MTFNERFNTHRFEIHRIDEIRKQGIHSIEKLVTLLKDIARLQETLHGNGGSDYETDHMTADELLLAYINSEEVTEAFNNIIKWYA